MEKNEFQAPVFEQFKVMAGQLDALQKKENDGRGVSCIRTIIDCLNKNNIESAKAVCINEGDKINNYPEIKQFLISHLFKNEKHPWTLSE